MNQFEPRLAKVEEIRFATDTPLGVIVVPAGASNWDAFVRASLAEMSDGGVVVIPAKGSIR